MRPHKNNSQPTPRQLQFLAQDIRLDVLDMVMLSCEGHLGGAFSCMEILVVLYFQIMRLNPQMPDWKERDRFILSKGHACYALYAVLARRGFFSRALLTEPDPDKWIFAGHPSIGTIPGIEVSTGSLGHGLSIGVGLALANKNSGSDARTFVLLGDGECQEGAVWEAAMMAAAHHLDKLIAIVDVNSLQALGDTENILSLEPFLDKWHAFGWDAVNVAGHDCEALFNVLNTSSRDSGKPLVVIARTVKGKGVSYMENIAMWHSRVPSTEEFDQAVKELSVNE